MVGIKTVRLEEPTWHELMKLRVIFKKRSLNDTIIELLDAFATLLKIKKLISENKVEEAIKLIEKKVNY
ncbi:MAG: hypothetical protein QW648_03665 [Nanoarchaeales archaeon]